MRFRRALAIIISVILVLSCLPGNAVYAEELPINSVYILVTTNNEMPTGTDDPDILNTKPAIGSDIYLWVMTSAVNELVGADVGVSYNPSFLDVADMDTTAAGIQPVKVPTVSTANEVSLYNLTTLNAVEILTGNNKVRYAASNTSPANYTQGALLLKTKFVVKADITSGLYFSVDGLELRGKFGSDNNPIKFITNETKPFHLAVDAAAKVVNLETKVIADLTVSANMTAAETALTTANTAIGLVPSGSVKTSLQTRATAAQTVINNVKSASSAVTALQLAALKDLTVLANLTDAEAKVTTASTAISTLAAGSTKTTLQSRFNTASTTVTNARTTYNAKNNTTPVDTTPTTTNPPPADTTPTTTAPPSTTTTTTTTPVDTNVTQSADTLNSAANGTQPISNTTQLNDAVNQAVSSLNNKDENKQTANITVIATGIIANASDIAAKVADTTQKEAFISTTVNAITAVVNAAASVKTEANAVELAASFKAITQEISTLLNATTSTTTQQQLAAQQVKLADTMQTVVENVIASTGTVRAVTNNMYGTVTVSLNQQAITDLLAKADAIVVTANNLNTAVASSGINVTVEKKVTLEVVASTGVKTVNAELPSTVLEQIQAKGVETVVIESGVAKITIAPDFITKTADTQTIALGVQKVVLTDDVISTMNDQQKALVQGAGEIYDFNAVLKDASAAETKVSNFNSSIEISLPYTLKPGEDKNNITILYLADDGTVKNMAGVYDEVSGTVVFSTNHFSKYVIKNNVVKFSDVASGNWAKTEIETMASKGIISGNLGKYLPENNVTRAEFAKLITTALNIVDDKATTSLKDVSKDAWYYTYVASAVKAGIISGNGDGSFAPNETISRQDMAIMLARAITKIKGEAGVSAASSYISSFVDKNNIAAYAVEGVATAIKHKLMAGKPGNMVDPLGKVTRAEAAVVIYRLFNK